jgi:hypothetical protein
MGGYLAGRLRTRWVNVHTHEVYFRDTAHGFLVWAVGLVITAAFLTSAAASFPGECFALAWRVAGREFVPRKCWTGCLFHRFIVAIDSRRFDAGKCLTAE